MEEEKCLCSKIFSFIGWLSHDDWKFIQSMMDNVKTFMKFLDISEINELFLAPKNNWQIQIKWLHWFEHDFQSIPNEFHIICKFANLQFDLHLTCIWLAFDMHLTCVWHAFDLHMNFHDKKLLAHFKEILNIFL